MFIQFHHSHLKLQFLKSRCKPCQLGIGASLMFLQLLSCITLILRSELTSFQWNLWSPFQLLFLVDQVAVLFQMLASYLNGAHWFLVSTWDPCPCKFFRIPFASTQYTLYWLFMWILYCLKFPREFHQQTIGHLLSKWSCWLPLRYHHLGPQARLLDHHKLVQVLVRILELILANAKNLRSSITIGESFGKDLGIANDFDIHFSFRTACSTGDINAIRATYIHCQSWDRCSDSCLPTVIVGA